MIDRILVPLDGSAVAAQALPYALALAEPDADIVLLRVVPPLHGLAGQLIVTQHEVQARDEEVAQYEIERESKALKERGMTVSPEVVLGDPAAQILRVAAERAVGMIAMTTHGRGAVGRFLFGSVADRVARASLVPVCLIRPRPEAVPPIPPAIQRVLVPLDGSDLAAEALPVAAALARRLAIPVHLVCAVDPVSALPVSSGLGGESPMIAAELYEEIERQATADARRTLEAVASQLRNGGVPTTWEVLTGSPLFVIPATTRPGDLLVMTSHGRGGVRRWLVGSVAEKLVREAEVPIVLVPTSVRRGGDPAAADVAIAAVAPESAAGEAGGGQEQRGGAPCST